MSTVRKLTPQKVVGTRVMTAKLLPSNNWEEGSIAISDGGDILKFEGGKFIRKTHIANVLQREYINSNPMPIFKLLEREDDLVLGLLYRLINNSHLVTSDE